MLHSSNKLTPLIILRSLEVQSNNSKHANLFQRKGCSMYLQLNVNYHREFQLVLTHNSMLLSDKIIMSSVVVKQNPAKSEISLRSRNGTNRQRAPLVCLCGLIWPWPAQGASCAWERSSVSHLSDCGESVSHQISRSFTRVGGFISLFCNNTCWLPSCFAVIYNSSPLEFAEIPKATAQIR